ncbi:uncharacterized protein L203_103927 [Cryptococcus depauperatus CBS 7841]|uniref:STE3 n=1 Tax=Cryptococcus depauperatus CBS 7841 TaxID=1295531 RepID=A0AAJ8JUU7_9TREE
MRHLEYPAWNFIALVLVILPAPWHWRARNIATMSLVFWLTLANSFGFINVILWSGNVEDRNGVWCDISSRIPLLVSYAVPLCSLSQMQKLESLASTRQTRVSIDVARRRLWQEVVVCGVLPVALTALQYIVQGHRYDIIEGIGCSNPTFKSVPGMIIRFAIPMAASVASLIFAALAVRWFLIRRLQFRNILQTAETRLSVSRYLRLIALAVTDSLTVLVVVAYALTNALLDGSSPMRHYDSWAQVHANFSQISQFPEELFGSSWPAVVTSVFAPVIYSILFFIFFGFGEEAVSEYLAMGERAWLLLRRLGRKSRAVDSEAGLAGNKCETARDCVNLGSKAVPIVTDSDGQEELASVDTLDKGRSFAFEAHSFPISQGDLDIVVKVERSVV